MNTRVSKEMFLEMKHQKELGVPWACANKIVNGISACHSRHIREDILTKTYVAALKKMTGDYDKVMTTLQDSAWINVNKVDRKK